MTRETIIAALAAIAVAAGAVPAGAQDKVSFGTDWRAQAEHGCFYQAQAAGIYREHGLDVTIRQGGPNLNHRQLMINGALDFNMGSNAYGALNFAKEGIPMVAVAAMFQKLPAVLIAHPGVGNDGFEALKGKPILISTDARATWWLFLKQRFGYTDAQVRPYTFNSAPFLADRNAVQQGYLSSEPFSIEREGRFKPVVMLVADAGFASYSTLIETSERMVRERPDVVQRFVDASIVGWYNFIYGDPKPALEMIKKLNPDLDDKKLAEERDQVIKLQLVDSGDALSKGIGAIDNRRIRDFGARMVKAGIYKPGEVDPDAVAVERFVNKKVGMDLKKTAAAK